jgi:TatD DNase family protein
MRLVDTHAHIHDREFDADPREADAAVSRASSAGVELIVTLGMDLENSRAAVALASRHVGTVVAAAGVHPHAAKDASEADLDALEELAGDRHVGLVGEIGIDYYRNFSPRDAQIRVMERQLDTAERVSKPIAVHAREAHQDVMPMLTRWSARMGGALADKRPLGVMHYFSADADVAKRYIDFGFMISVHTSVTHPKAHQLADVVRAIPLDCMVIETDSPFGAPQRYRGRRNEPAYVVEAALRIAEIKGVPVETVADATTRNAERLLGIGAIAEERRN